MLRMRPLAIANLVAQVVIIVTGAAVRLTDSGLGCDTWPRCNGESFVAHREYGIHGAIEFGNRLLTYVLVAVAIATVVAARRWHRERRDLFRLALLTLLGIPVQAVIGGISVLMDLNPWVVGLHFLASSVLVGLSTLLMQRTADAGGPGRLDVPPLFRVIALVQLAVLAVTLVVGTIVTGSGPHAGDADAPRNGLDPEALSQLHADFVFLLVGVTVALWLALKAVHAPVRAQRAALVLLGVELGQGVIGFVQYFTDLPVVLVAVHMLGAALLVVAAVRALDVLTLRPALFATDVMGTAEPDGEQVSVPPTLTRA